MKLKDEKLDPWQLWDISPTLHEGIAVFPGDTSFQREILLDTQKGDPLGLSWIKTTLHAGAHADATNHYHAKGKGIEERELRDYFGPCFVADMTHILRSSRIEWSDFESRYSNLWDFETSPRILFKTLSFPDPDRWNSDFVSLSPQLIQKLSEKKVKLVGIDTPSVDPADSKKLESHQALFETKMAVLEGLDLRSTPEGFYHLIALPLKIRNADASPVRAILVRPS